MITSKTKPSTRKSSTNHVKTSNRNGKKAAAAEAPAPQKPALALDQKTLTFVDKSSTDHGISLVDRLLIVLKDGTAIGVSKLLKKVQDDIPARLIPANGSPVSDQELLEGKRQLVVKALDKLLQCKRIKVDGSTTDDPWPSAATVQLIPSALDVRFQIAPEYSRLLPRGSATEDAELERQIILKGGCDPLVTWVDGSKTYLVDGHRRLEICLRHGIKYELEPLQLPNRDAVIEWIWTSHYGRRNFTKQAQSYWRGARYNAVKQKPGGDRTSKKAKAQNAPMDRTAAKLAAEFKVSRVTIIRDGQFAEHVDHIVSACFADTGMDFRSKLLSREIALTNKKVEVLAGKSKATINSMVGKLLKNQAVSLADSNGTKPKSLSIPYGKADAQAKALFDQLGPSKVEHLISELTKLIDEQGLPAKAVGEQAQKQLSAVP